MMPPHVTSIEMPAGGLASGGEIRIHGWSLVFTEPGSDLKVASVDSGDSVPFDWDIDSEDVGEGDLPGAVQVRCVLRVRPRKLVPGRSYRVEYLGEAATFVAR